jgi:hypothetical protein
MSNKTFSTIAFLLALLMIISRTDHFGSAVQLPDASLAVFFLGGFYLRRYLGFIAYLLLAGGSDYLSISGGTSGWCVSPAYVFLVPTYAAMWFAGRWYQKHYAISLHSLTLFCLALFCSSSFAFIISNGGFYLFSGRFTDLSWVEYTSRVQKYYLPYVTTACAYVICAACLQILSSYLRRGGNQQTNEAL